MRLDIDAPVEKTDGVPRNWWISAQVHVPVYRFPGFDLAFLGLDDPETGWGVRVLSTNDRPRQRRREQDRDGVPLRKAK